MVAKRKISVFPLPVMLRQHPLIGKAGRWKLTLTWDTIFCCKTFMDIPVCIDDNHVSLTDKSEQGNRFPSKVITIMPQKTTAITAEETDAQRFVRILSRSDFKPLQALFDNLRVAVMVMQDAIVTTGTYRNFLDKLGYRLIVVKQIHEQDCYARIGPTGGIRAVLPVHDVATYSTMVTLVNLDSTVSTTSNSVDFYDEQIARFKILLMNKSGDAA
jgi:hypothetical protein